MPTFDYKCQNGHIHERVKIKPNDRNPKTCPKCGENATRMFAAPHVPVDGVYSYAPNEGNEEKFVRWNEKIAKQKEAEREARG